MGEDECDLNESRALEWLSSCQLYTSLLCRHDELLYSCVFPAWPRIPQADDHCLPKNLPETPLDLRRPQTQAPSPDPSALES